MKFFLLDILQKTYLNIVIFFDKFFNLGNGKKKKISLTGLSGNMIFYLLVYIFFVFVFDVLFFNEEFFVSFGLILFILFVRGLLTDGLMPFYFQYKNYLERSIYELSESIFLLSSKLYKYYSIELYFLRILKENLYGISIFEQGGTFGSFVDDNLDIGIKNGDFTRNNVNGISAMIGTSVLRQIEQTYLLNHLEACFQKVFGFFVNDVFFIYFNFQYQLRLSFYANLVKNNKIVRVPLTQQEQAMSNFLIF